jgi:hypothetical protein
LPQFQTFHVTDCVPSAASVTLREISFIAAAWFLDRDGDPGGKTFGLVHCRSNRLDRFDSAGGGVLDRFDVLGRTARRIGRSAPTHRSRPCVHVRARRPTDFRRRGYGWLLSTAPGGRDPRDKHAEEERDGDEHQKAAERVIDNAAHVLGNRPIG